MSSLQLEEGINGGANRSRIVAVSQTPPVQFDQEEQPRKSGWKNFQRFIGPGFLVSMAYMDPGSLQTDLTAGSNHGYELLWVVLVAMIFALVVQTLAANLGVMTGKHLSEQCKAEYPKIVRYFLCVFAETAVISADITEVLGTAFALNILFKLPLWIGVICTTVSTLLLLGVQRFGERKLEMIIAILILLMACCFFAELAFVNPPAKEVVHGLFVPQFKDSEAVRDTIAIIGATVMPHNLFLHSALVLSRKVPNSVRGVKYACRNFLIETGFAMFVALLLNVAVVSVVGAVCGNKNISKDNADRCGDLSLNAASFLLKNVLGKGSFVVYGIALLASGQSSTVTSTYAGQYIMEGFVELKMTKWVRNLVTRCTAIIPSLIVSLIGGASAAAQLIIIASMILSYELPYALIPLLKFSSSPSKMGPHKNSIVVIMLCWVLQLVTIGINVHYIFTTILDWLKHNKWPVIGNVFMGILVFSIVALYIGSLGWLIFRKDTVVTFKSENSEPIVDERIEDGSSREVVEDQLQQRVP